MIMFMRAGRPLKKRPTSFGQRLADLRKQAELSQAQLGEKLGLSARAIANWEMRSTTSLRPGQYIRLAEIFDVSLDTLIRGSDSPKKDLPGPKGKLKKTFESASKLSPREQAQIINVVSALILQANQASQAKAKKEA